MPGLRAIGGEVKRWVISCGRRCRKVAGRIVPCRRRPKVTDGEPEPTVRRPETEKAMDAEEGPSSAFREEETQKSSDFEDGVLEEEKEEEKEEGMKEEEPEIPGLRRILVKEAPPPEKRGKEPREPFVLEFGDRAPQRAPKPDPEAPAKDVAVQTLFSETEAIAPLKPEAAAATKDATTQTLALDLGPDRCFLEDLEKVEHKPEGADEAVAHKHAVFEAQLRSSSGLRYLHSVCQVMAYLDLDLATEMADILARRHFKMVLEHYLDAWNEDCAKLMYAVVLSPKGNLDATFHSLLSVANKGDSLLQAKALRAIEVIIKEHKNIRKIRRWLPFLQNTLSNALLVELRNRKEGEANYISQKEILEIVRALMERMDLMTFDLCNMDATL